MQFKDIIGQRVLINRITQIIDSGRIPHSQLLLGSNGYGALALALAYAQYLNCEHRQHYPVSDPEHDLAADSCGECPSCKKMQALVHADLHLIFPTAVPKGASAENVCSNLYMDTFIGHALSRNLYTTYEDWISEQCSDKKQGMIREKDAANIVQTLSMTTYESKYKVLLIWMPEKMNSIASNEVLKTLEEPTPNTVILMVADNADKILPTILSRAQVTRIPRIADEDIVRAIATHTDISGQESAIASAAEGDFIRARQYLDAGNTERQYAGLFVEWMRKLFKLNMIPLTAWVDSIHNMSRDEQQLFLRYAQDAVRACFLKTAAGIVLSHRIQFGDEKFNNRFPFMISVNNIESINAAFDEAIMAISRNGYDKLVFMRLSFALSSLLKKA